MSTMTIDLHSGAEVPATGVPGAATRFADWWYDVWSLTRRNLIHVWREPAQLSDATFQPVLFTLLFIGLFGGAMSIPGGGSYKGFAIGGLVAMNLTTAAMGTAVGLSSDLTSGVIDRFRTLPIARSAILTSRTISDLLASTLAATIVIATGLAIGWRPGTGVGGVIAGIAVAVAFSYALSWFCACLGLLVRDPESAQAIGMVILFPVAFVSTCFVPPQGLTPWLRTVANWNPVSAMAGACRDLFGNTNPAALQHTFPAQHPVPYLLAWTVAIIVVCAPLASHLLRRRTAD